MIGLEINCKTRLLLSFKDVWAKVNDFLLPTNSNSTAFLSGAIALRDFIDFREENDGKRVQWWSIAGSNR